MISVEKNPPDRFVRLRLGIWAEQDEDHLVCYPVKPLIDATLADDPLVFVFDLFALRIPNGIRDLYRSRRGGRERVSRFAV